MISISSSSMEVFPYKTNDFKDLTFLKAFKVEPTRLVVNFFKFLRFFNEE